MPGISETTMYPNLGDEMEAVTQRSISATHLCSSLFLFFKDLFTAVSGSLQNKEDGTESVHIPLAPTYE